MIGRQSIWLLAAALAAPFLIIAFAILQPFTEPRLLFLDPAIVVRTSGECCKPYHGAISSLGIMTWAATAAICLLVWRIGWAGRFTPAQQRFFLGAGLLTGWLALDDALLFHEEILPRLGVHELVIYASYASAALAQLWVNWRIILTFQWVLFCLAGFALAASIATDLLLDYVILLEDSAKVIGISCWAAFHVHAAVQTLLADKRQTG